MLVFYGLEEDVGAELVSVGFSLLVVPAADVDASGLVEPLNLCIVHFIPTRPKPPISIPTSTAITK